MATATLQYPPSNHVLPGTSLLPTAHFPNPQAAPDSSGLDSALSPEAIAAEWVSSFNRLVTGEDLSQIEIFLNQSWWRDLLCVDWDFHTLQGPEQIAKFITSSSQGCRITNVSLCKSPPHKTPQIAAAGGLRIVQAFLEVETANGRGEGLVRLISDPNDGGRWKAFTLFTSLKELQGHEESTHDRRPTGVNRVLHNGNTNWKDRLTAQQSFDDGREPTVLILGL